MWHDQWSWDKAFGDRPVEPTLLFLDTEWADLPGLEIVSVALISEDGQHQFYAERDPLPSEPTEFVRQSVYPLLDRGRAAMADIEFTKALRSFLRSIPNPRVVYDYPNDGVLLQIAISGFGRLASELLDSGPLPSGTELMLLVGDDLTSMILEDWFISNPDQAVRRHHALVDAAALRTAGLAAHGKIDAE